MNTVTGAFGFSGREIARRLIDMGESVQTLTNSRPADDPFKGAVVRKRLDFDDPDSLTRSLEGTTTFYNTYWIRFGRGSLTYEKAVRNTQTLIHAAKRAGVRRFVHVSIANPEAGARYGYYRGKVANEKALRESGLSYGILRPTVLFGEHDILLNNVAYLLRRFPFFAVPGDGKYGIQPIWVGDEADIAVRLGHQRENVVVDAAGPEAFTFDDLLNTIGRAVNGRRSRLLHLPPALTWLSVQPLNWLLRDVVITKWEIDGLMDGLLASKEQPLGRVRFSDWVKEHAPRYGRAYNSELNRHYKRRKA